VTKICSVVASDLDDPGILVEGMLRSNELSKTLDKVELDSVGFLFSIRVYDSVVVSSFFSSCRISDCTGFCKKKPVAGVVELCFSSCSGGCVEEVLSRKAGEVVGIFFSGDSCNLRISTLRV